MKTKSNFFLMIVSSTVCLLPIILSLVVYNDLPEKIAMHYNLSGNPTWYANKAVAAFGLPLMFMLINIIARIALNNDPKRENQSKVTRLFGEWLIPLLSITIVPILLYSAMGAKIPIHIFVGIIIIICGNYMPKHRQNYFIGIKLPWTLKDSDNWYKTHRMAGFLWVFGGIAFIILTFLPFDNTLLFLPIFVILIIIPVIYSWSLYIKSKKDYRNEAKSEF